MKSPLTSKSVSSRIGKGVSWSIAGFILSKGFTLATAVYLSHLIGKAPYGEFGVVQNTVGLFGILGGAGMGLAATKFIASFRHINKVRASRVLGIVVISSILFCLITIFLLLVLARPLASNTLNNTDLIGALRWGCLLLFANVSFEILSGTLAGFEDFKSNSLAEMVRGIMVFPTVLLLAPNYQVEGAVVAFALASIGGAGFLFLRLKKVLVENDIRINTQEAFKEFGIITKFSIPALISGSLSVPALWISVALITHLPNGYEELGVYNAANQMRMLIMMIPLLLSRVLVPLLSKEHELNNTANYNKAIEGANFATITLVLPATVILLFLGENIMLLFGEDFRQGWPVLNCILAGTAISAIGSVIGSAVIATGYMWVGALQNFVWATTYTFFVFIQYKKYGALALANSFLASHVILIVITVIFLHRRKLISGELFRNIMISTTMVVALTLISFFLNESLRYLMIFPIVIFVIFVCNRWLMTESVKEYLVRKGGFKVIFLRIFNRT